MELSKRAKEIKAANAVRRVIQKIRLATPETFDELEAEAFDVMAANLEDMGEQHEKVQDELDKGLDLGRKRVEQILEKREQEAELAKRPKELMEEIKTFIEDLKPKVDELERAAGLVDGAEALTPATASAARKKSDELSKATKHFSQECVTRATEIKAANLPPETHKEWTALAQQIVQMKQKCERMVLSTKNSVSKVLHSIRKEKAEKQKMEIRTLIESAASALPGVEQLVRGLELEVQPFIVGKFPGEAEMLALAERVEDMVVKARKAVTAARENVAKPVKVEEEEDPDLQEDLQAFTDKEVKRSISRLGLCDRRLHRIDNIVRNFRQDLRSIRNREMLGSLKAELLNKVKDVEHSSVLTSIEPILQKAEKVVLPTLKNSSMSMPEMQALAEVVLTAVETAKAEFTKAEQAICPIDASLDEDLKRKLRCIVAPQIKKPMLQLGQLERRLNRVRNLLKMFQADMVNRRGGSHKQARKVLLRIVRRHMSTSGLDPDGVFDAANAGAGTVDESAFVSFCEGLDKKVPKDDSEELEALDLPSEALATVFSAFLEKGKDSMDRDAFVRCACGRMSVVKPTTLTSDLNISEGKMMRALQANEVLECLEGPVREKRTGVRRVRVRALKDGKTGWATVMGSAGTVFLKEADP